MKVYKFSAIYCGPCRMYASTFKKIKEEYKDRVEFLEIDIDQDEALTKQFNISSIPTTVLVDNENNEIGRYNEIIDEQKLRNLIDDALAS